MISKFYSDLENSLNEQREKQLQKLNLDYQNLTNSAGETYKSIHDKLQNDLDEFDKFSMDDRWSKEVESKKERGEDSKKISNSKREFYNDLKKQRADLQKKLDAVDKAALEAKAVKEIEINNQINKQIEEANKKKNKALEIENQNSKRNQSVEDRLYETEQSKAKLQDQLRQLEVLKEVQGSFTKEQIQQQEDLKAKLKEVNEKYDTIRKTIASGLTQRQRFEQFKDEVRTIQDEAKEKRLQNKLDNKEGTEAYKQREREISREEKDKTKAAQETYGFTTGGGSLIKSLVTGVSQAISGGDSGGGLADVLSSTLGAISGPIGILVKVVSSIFSALGSLNRLVDSGIQRAVDSQSAYLGQINARLYGIRDDTYNYYTEMIDWSRNSGDFGLAIGRWNATADRQTYIQKLNDLVQSGIAYNAEERAYLATIADRLVTTFDVMDATLTRLVRLQQLDVTTASLGSEALLTKFLNSQAWITDTSYLSDMYDSVSSILLDAMAKLSADEANAFNYEVQKWLGSLYSLGLSQQGVQSLAQGITYLQTGDVSNLSSNQQLQYIYAAAADRAGLSLGDILVQGLDIETTNLLLQNVVTLLQDIYDNSQANTVQSAWTNITGMSISDLRAISNVSSEYLASISSEHESYSEALNESTKQLNMLSTNVRTGIAQAIDNIINNSLLNVGDTVMNSQFETLYKTDPQHGTPVKLGIMDDGWTLEGAIADAVGIGGMNKYVAYRLGKTLGGTVGSILESVVTVPAIIEEVTKFVDEELKGKDVGSFRSEKGRFGGLSTAIDYQLINRLSAQYKLMDSYYNDYEKYMENLLLVRSAQNNVTESASITDLMTYMSIEDAFQLTQSQYNDYLTRNGQITAADMTSFTNSLNELVETSNQMRQTNYDAQLYNQSSLEFLDTNYSNQLQTFESQATAIEAQSAAISNQSEEDQQVLDQVKSVEDYIFQNERTIRVTLVDLEEPAELYFNRAPEASDLYQKIVEMWYRMTQTSVPVDVIDNDMNSLMYNIYQVKQS